MNDIKLIGKSLNYRLHKNGVLEKRRVNGDWKPMKATKHSVGYLRYCIDGSVIYAHRLVAIHFVPNPSNFPEVDHIDGDKTNNDASNLEWVTHAKNIDRARARLGDWNKYKHTKLMRADGMMFDSVKDAADFHNIKYSTFAPMLARAIKNDWRCMGFRWSRV